MGNSADACYTDWVSWELSSSDYRSRNQYYITETYPPGNTTEFYDYQSSHECTMTCGSICYAGPVTYYSSTSIYPKPTTSVYLKDSSPYPSSPPNCTIGPSDCDRLLTSVAWYLNSYYLCSRPATVTAPTLVPPQCETTCTSTTCTIWGVQVSMLYWPVTTSVSRDYCAWDPVGDYVPYTRLRNNSKCDLHILSHPANLLKAYVPTTTGIYAISDGVTMYQGNVYLSFQLDHVMAVDNCDKEIPRHNPGRNVLAVGSHEMYSYRHGTFRNEFGQPQKSVIRPVTFADFSQPIPWRYDPSVRLIP